MGSFVNQTLLAELTPDQKALYDEDRRPALYASLAVLLVINNVVVGLRFLARYHNHYKRGWDFRNIQWEDPMTLLSAACINVVIANLIASTSYGLGLHSWRINAEDPAYPQNLSNAFKHVWITMVFTGPTFTCIKLTLLFFYKRMFLVNQRWLRLAWWVNIAYVALWFVGATGFYLFQCAPSEWYFMQYYAKYKRQPPYAITGQCNATTTTHVAIPLIFGMASDIAILILPVFAIAQLRTTRKTKLGLTAVFCIGAISCFLDMARIIELFVDTDDKLDPSFGVVIFLILSAATEVGAITCACLPVVGAVAVKEYKSRNSHRPYGFNPNSNGPSSNSSKRLHSNFSRKSRAFEARGFEPLEDGSWGRSADKQDTHVQGGLEMHGGVSNDSSDLEEGKIFVEREIEVTIGGEQHVPHAL